MEGRYGIWVWAEEEVTERTMSIRREDLEAAGRVVGTELAQIGMRHDLDSESWREWEEKQGGHGTGTRGRGQKSTVRAEPKARGLEENAHQTATTGGKKDWREVNAPPTAEGGHLSTQGYGSKEEAEAKIEKMKAYEDRDLEAVHDGTTWKVKFGPEKSESTAGDDPLNAWEKKWPYKVTRHENGTISVPDSVKDEEHRASLWRMPGYRVTSVRGGTIWLDKKSKDDAKASKTKPRGIEDPTGGYPLVEARKKQVRDAARKAKKA